MSTVSTIAEVRNWDAARAAALHWSPPRVRTTVVVPHPDDEAVLFGGLIHVQRRRGVDVHVLAVTDGECAYPGADEADLARRRRAEQTTSLSRLGLAPDEVTRLGIGDGAVAASVDRLVDAISASEPGLVVAPWAHDHHTDHEACGRAARRAAEILDAEVVGGLFWAWHRTSPAVLAGATLAELPLDHRARRARRQALAAHRTQLGMEFGPPVLGEDVLEPISWASEYYVPVCDVARGSGSSS
jgi:LmbE family N-acetylglucosaminyl deacetylase